jgi:hypothetical protein
MNLVGEHSAHRRRERQFVEHGLWTQEEATATMLELDKATDRWLRARQTEQVALYEEHLLPLVLKIFRCECQVIDADASRANVISPDILIQLVGHSAPPLLLMLDALRPATVVWIHTADTLEITHDLSDLMEVHEIPAPEMRHRHTLKGEASSDPAVTYRAILEHLPSVEAGASDGPTVAIDVTGGKKSMVAGAFMAGGVFEPYDVPLYYVDFEAFDPGSGRPIPGTEFLNQLVNPYALYSKRERAQIRELFNSHQYVAARTLLDAVLTKPDAASSPGDDLLAGIVAGLTRARQYADCYAKWDAFDYPGAVAAAPSSDVVAPIAPLTDADEEMWALSDDAYDAVRFRAVADRFASAARCREAGREKDALLRYIQVVEFTAQHRIEALQRRGRLDAFKGKRSKTTVKATGGAVSPRKVEEAMRKAKHSVTPLLAFLFGHRDVRDYSLPSTEVAVTMRDGNAWDASSFAPFDLGSFLDLVRLRNEFAHEVVPDASLPSSLAGAYDFVHDALHDAARRFLEAFVRHYPHVAPSEGDVASRIDAALEPHRFRPFDAVARSTLSPVPVSSPPSDHA